MTNINIADFKKLYVKTAREYVKSLQENLRRVKHDKKFQDSLIILHRNAHSLKGQSIVMGYNETATLAHLLENIFYVAQGKKTILTDEVIVLIKNSIDKILVSLQSIEKNGKEINLSEQVKNLEKSSGVTSKKG